MYCFTINGHVSDAGGGGDVCAMGSTCVWYALLRQITYILMCTHAAEIGFGSKRLIDFCVEKISDKRVCVERISSSLALGGGLSHRGDGVLRREDQGDREGEAHEERDA